VQGLKGKVSLLANYLNPGFSHIICITEHHLNDQEINITHFEHYKLSAKFCRKQLKNGGSCIYMHESINSEAIATEHVYKEKDLELCAIKLSLRKINIVLIVIYRSPSGDFDYFIKKLDTFLCSIYTKRTEYIICGDLNVDYLHSNIRKQNLDRMLATYNLTSILNFPTRIAKGSRTAIHNFFIDITSNYSINPLINALSDHDAQILEIRNVLTPSQDLTSLTIRDYNNYAIHDFLVNLSMENWENVFPNKNINTIFNKVLDTYLKIFNTCFKQKKFHSVHIHNPWVTKDIKISCNHKRELYLNCRNTNDTELLNRFKRYSKTLTNVIKAAKRLYNDELIFKSKNKIKTTWEIIRKETGKYNQLNKIESLKINNVIVSNTKEMAHKFNDHFSSIADSITKNIRKENDKHRNFNNHLTYLNNNTHTTYLHIHWKHTTSYEINKIIKTLKNSNSYGYDGHPTKIIKLSAPFITSPLTHICNQALSTGIFSERLKYALIRPVFKKGDKHLITNYRPISLLTSFSKIVEKLTFIRVHRHLHTYQSLANEQYGFKNNSSTENAVYHVINEITQAMNDRRSTGLFCDLEKAFDCQS
jgi:exonuclease III